ncbi:GSCOCG00003856001-RA-CDS [Cotesia congregata]|nr:GSCOCG00003856001-RA-CDS [Cotesia congregata]
MINTLFENDVVPSSKYKLFKTLKLNEDILAYHVYCRDCHHYFGAQDELNKNGLQCPICDNSEKPPDISYFLTFDISLQLKSILEDPKVQEIFLANLQDKENNENNNDLQSMSDGQIYKKLSTTNNPLSHKYNFSYTFNTDGCQPSKSSKLSIWPIYASINELPLKLQSKYMIMTGLWVNKEEPDMLLFLQPLVDAANKLSDEGVEWKLQQQTITSKFIPICAVVDSVARCKILNMKQYNGSYGCTFCEHPGLRMNNSQKFPITTVVPKERTNESVKEQMFLAGESEFGSDVMGVWGPSALINLMNYFDIVDGMSPDYMHAILLGVIKQHTEILLSSFGEDYYVGSPNQLEAINIKLLNFKHPTCITRSPRNLTERKMWKATEWRSWILFYSLICLKDILPQKYLEHLALLVEAMYILLSDRINSDELDTSADSLILRYVVLYEEYFGTQAMTYNIHLLLHLIKSVIKLGPLRCHNTFIFENENHFLMKLQKSPNKILIQIARRYMFQKALTPLKNKINTSNQFSQFCERNLTG